MTRTRAVIIGAVALLVAVGIGVWWLLGRGGEPTPVATSTEEPDQVAAALEVLETDPEELLPDGLAGSVDLATAIPAGTEVDADPATWVPSAAGGGLIELTLTLADGTTQRLVAVMAQVDGGWQVLQTIPVEGQS